MYQKNVKQIPVPDDNIKIFVSIICAFNHYFKPKFVRHFMLRSMNFGFEANLNNLTGYVSFTFT